MSFQIAISPSRRAAARFIGKVRRRLHRGLADNLTVKRTDIADALDVHRSVITRQLSGRQDISVGRVAEIAWALGYEPIFELRKRKPADGDNKAVAAIPAARPKVETDSTSGTVTRIRSDRVLVSA